MIKEPCQRYGRGGELDTVFRQFVAKWYIIRNHQSVQSTTDVTMTCYSFHHPDVHACKKTEHHDVSLFHVSPATTGVAEMMEDNIYLQRRGHSQSSRYYPDTASRHPTGISRTNTAGVHGCKRYSINNNV